MKHPIVGLVVAVMCISCDGKHSTLPNDEPLDDLVEEYLFIELSMGVHDSAHVDAYFGPQSIRDRATQAGLSLEEIRSKATSLRGQLQARRAQTESSTRIDGLIARLTALLARVSINSSEALPFDEESQLLFGVTAPDFDDQHFDEILHEIGALLPPSDAALADRVVQFQNDFVVSVDRLPVVFEAAIAECRARTLGRVALPDHESFSIEYVNDKPWSGYNWYQGDANSLIQVNTDLPIFIHRAVDLGCHEGYPGHHTFNVLLEKNLVQKAGWSEFTIYPLFSPASLIAEGSGNHGIELAFPGRERLEFERDVLFPLAGLEANNVETYYKLQSLLQQLKYAENEAARDYLNGTKSRKQTIEWLIAYTLSSEERSTQRVAFFDTYRSYIINYNFGMDMVREYIERDTANDSERWQRFEYMLSNPILPSDLLAQE